VEMVSNKIPAKKVKLQKYLLHHQLARSNSHVRKMIKEGKVYVNGVEARSVSIKVALDGNNGSVVVKPTESASRTTEFSASTLPVATGLTKSSDPATEDTTSEHHCQSFTNPPCILFHKPCGMICTTSFHAEFDTLVNISPTRPLPPGFHTVGRLDQHSHGLLLCSTDGRLTSALLSPKSQVPREYTVVVKGDVGDKTACGQSMEHSKVAFWT
jgi:16S rRNA U516 pseudouridylate synthase RsuA-like enzyme